MSDTICVLGGGSWGATIASHLAKQKQPVTVWEFNPAQVEKMRRSRSLDFLPQLKIPESVAVTADMKEALSGAAVVFSVVPSQFVRSTWQSANKLSPKPEIVVSLTKGIEAANLRRMSEIIEEECPAARGKVVVLSGPSHAEEVAQEIPTALTAASADKELAEKVQRLLSTHKFRVYTNPDVLGVEICAAIKNIFAIACGACDGLGLGDNTKAALVTRGLSEMARLGRRMGAKEATFFGLAGMGDLVVTCFSRHSRNRHFGEMIGKGRSVEEALQSMTMVAEGVPTAKSAYLLARKYDCDCPIITELYRVLYEKKDIRQSLTDLMTRPPRSESDELKWS